MAASPGSEAPHEFLLRVSKPGLCLSWPEMRNARKLCEVAKHFLQRRWASLISRHLGEPALLSYSCDSTPLVTRESYKRAFGPDRVVRRHGRQAGHFDVQRVWFRSGGEVGVLFTEPAKTGDGSAWTAFSGYLSLTKTLREYGHRGLVITHHVEDRLHHSAMKRLHLQHNAAIHAQLSHGHPPGQSALLRLQHWEVSSGCCCHDVHNGYKWGLLANYTDVDVMKSAYITVESLRNSFSQLVSNLPGWLATVLTFEDDRNAEHRYDMWVCLGVVPDLIEALMELHLRWEAGRLVVARSFEARADCWEAVSFALLSLWRYAEWSDSRWLSMGSACKVMLASMATGLDSLLAHIRAKRSESDYFLHGVERCTSEVREFFGAASIAAWVSDSILELMLADDRVPRQMGDIDEELRLEVQYVSELPQPVMNLLATAIGCSSRSLRSKATSAALTSAAYIVWKLQPAKELPWTLCGPDMEQQVQALYEGARPTEPTAQKIWDLLQLGFDRQSIFAGLSLMSNIGWSSTPTEQGHLPMSKMAQRHKGYSQESLRCRAMLTSMQPLLTPSAEEAAAAELRQKLIRLERRQPNKCSGRHVYMRDLHMRAKAALTVEQAQGPKLQKHIMKTHGARWATLPAATKHVFESEAALSVAESMTRLAAERDKVREELEDLRRARSSGGGADSPWRLSHCKFSEAEVAEFDRLWDDPRFGGKNLERLREAAMQDLQPPSEAFQALLAAYEPPPSPARPRLPWLQGVLRHRDFFAGSILKVEHGGTCKTVIFLHGMQNPAVAFFIDAIDREAAERDVQPQRFGQQVMSQWRHEFEWAPMAFSFSDDGQYHPDARVSVLVDTVFLEGRIVATDAVWKSVDDTLLGLPPIARKVGEKPQVARPARPGAELLEAEPWLLDFLGKSGQRAAAATLPNNQTASVASGSAAQPADDEEVVVPEQVYDELEQMRLRLGVPASRRQHFSWGLLGGTWTRKHRGKSCDAFGARACTQEAKAFCRWYSMNITVRFSVGDYGERHCAMLCEYWVAKNTFFHGIWQANGSAQSYRFRDEDISSFEEPQDFLDLFGGARGALLARMQDLRAIRPARP